MKTRLFIFVQSGPSYSPVPHSNYLGLFRSERVNVEPLVPVFKFTRGSLLVRVILPVQGGNVVKVVDREMFRDITIKEGVVFLLPGEAYVSCCGRSLLTYRSISQYTTQSCMVHRHHRDRHGNNSPGGLEW